MKSHFVRRWFWWIFAALVIAVLAWPRAEADVYIDPDATCHGAGTISAPLCAWPSVYAGGETYRQKRGTTTASTIRITSRTNPDALLTLGTYGEGARPIIDASADVPGITDPARWTGAEDVWRFAHGYRAQPLVLAINGRRLLGPAITMAELCSAPGSQTIMYATDASYLNLCSVTNPAAWIHPLTAAPRPSLTAATPAPSPSPGRGRERGGSRPARPGLRPRAGWSGSRASRATRRAAGCARAAARGPASGTGGRWRRRCPRRPRLRAAGPGGAAPAPVLPAPALAQPPAAL